MSRPARLALGLLVAAAATLAVAALSRVPYEVDGSVAGVDAGGGAAGGSLIRLSWRTRGETVRECRRLSAAEIEALPIHMRREEVCEGSVLPYRLRVSLDGRAVVDDTVRAAGARSDRPLYVFRELPVPPGAHRLVVRWEPARAHEDRGDHEEDEDEDEDEDEEARAPGAGLALEASLRLEPGEIALVTRDADGGELVARLPPRRAPATPSPDTGDPR